MQYVSNEKIVKKHTQATAFSVLELIKDLDVLTIITDIFVYTKSPIAKELIKKYEGQIIDAKTEPYKFRTGLYDFFRYTAFFIKDNNLYKEFFSFFYFVYSTLTVRNGNKNKSLDCYINLLIQQITYFTEPPLLVCGLETNGSLMTISEPFPYIDIPFMINPIDFMKTEKGIRKWINDYKSLGYDIKSINDYMYYNNNDQFITNTYLLMANFINENTSQIVVKNPYMILDLFKTLEPVVTTDIYRELLKEKRYLLPTTGIRAVYHNCGQLAEVLFQEIFTEDRFMLLYKVTATNQKEFSGFYDTKLELFFSPWEDTNGAKISKIIENIILETYCYLTTDIEELLDISLKKRLEVINLNSDLDKNLIPAVSFLYKKPQSIENKDTTIFHPFDKTKYSESKVKVQPYIRKLPLGAKASDEAQALAREYHILIGKDETFVKPFEKKVYKKSE